MSSTTNTVNLYSCDTLTCIDVSGADAISFLQSQLTQDVAQVSAQRAALAGYCSAQGRLLATMILCPSSDPSAMRLVVKKDLAESLVKRLRMFVLRSKVTLQINPAAAVFAVTSNVSDSNAVPGELLDGKIWSVAMQPGVTWVRAPGHDASKVRCWVISDDGSAPTVGDAQTHASSGQWEAEEILAGMPWIQEATKDLFIPQSLNLDLIEGVSFSKGCYPGQEVVARAHYRAKVKRRMHAAILQPASDAVVAAADIHPEGKPDEPCGRVIQVATSANKTYLLFEAPMTQVQEGALCAVPSSQPLTLVPLPYDISSQ